MSRTAIISVDGHVKASRAGYRDYVEQQYLEDFDRWVKAADDAGLPDAGNLNPAFGVDAQWDSDKRLPAGECRCGRRGPVPQRSAVPGESTRGLRPHAESRTGCCRTPGLQPVARRLLCPGSRATGRPGRDLLRRHRPGRRGRPMGQGARPGRDHDAAAQPWRHLLLRSRPRPGLASHPGSGLTDQPARRRQHPGLRPRGIRRDDDGHGGERVLLEPVAVDAHLGRCVRPLPRLACVTSRPRRTCWSPRSSISTAS